MRMPREAGEIVFRHIVAKIVKEQERIVVGCLAESECAAQMHAGAFERGLADNQLPDWTDRHDGSPQQPQPLLMRFDLQSYVFRERKGQRLVSDRVRCGIKVTQCE